jgi:hypothetical protein
MMGKGPFYLGPMGFRRTEMIGDADLRDLDDAIHVLDVTFYLRRESAGRNGDLTRFQRAGKGAGQSAGHRGDHVIERGGVFVFGLYTIEVGDAAVDTIVKGFLEMFDIGKPMRTLPAHDPRLAGMHEFSHKYLLFRQISITKTLPRYNRTI